MTLQTWFSRTPVGLRSAFVHAMNLYPPFVGAGIRVTAIATDLSRFDVEMRLNLWNRNLLGAHFGGSLYAMCDPFFMLALTTQLGPDYMVWDKHAAIEFRRPGRGTVRACFTVSPAEVADIRARVARDGKCEPTFEADVLGPNGEIVATVHKHLWVKKKAAITAPTPTEVRHAHPTA